VGGKRLAPSDEKRRAPKKNPTARNQG